MKKVTDWMLNNWFVIFITLVGAFMLSKIMRFISNLFNPVEKVAKEVVKTLSDAWHYVINGGNIPFDFIDTQTPFSPTYYKRFSNPHYVVESYCQEAVKLMKADGGIFSSPLAHPKLMIHLGKITHQTQFSWLAFRYQQITGRSFRKDLFNADTWGNEKLSIGEFANLCNALSKMPV